MEAYAGRAAMQMRAEQRQEKGEKTDLFKIMKERGRTKLTSAVWSRALERGDKIAVELIDEAIEALGAGVASAQNLLDVEAIVIGGGLGVRLGEPYVRRIRRAMEPHIFNDANPPDVLLAGLGDLGGALGAALLVSQRGSPPAPAAAATAPRSPRRTTRSAATTKWATGTGSRSTGTTRRSTGTRSRPAADADADADADASGDTP
jgi:hypothetical protein